MKPILMGFYIGSFGNCLDGQSADSLPSPHLTIVGAALVIYILLTLFWCRVLLFSFSTVVAGIVCKKNVAHRRMRTRIDKPRIMILGGALEYQRVSNVLSSFDTLLQQVSHPLLGLGVSHIIMGTCHGIFCVLWCFRSVSYTHLTLPTKRIV